MLLICAVLSALYIIQSADKTVSDSVRELFYMHVSSVRLGVYKVSIYFKGTNSPFAHHLVAN